MTPRDAPVVIVGAGHAGVECAAAIRRTGGTRPIVLVSAEDQLPYQRPPLSKTYMAGDTVLPIRGERFYADEDIDLRSGVVAVDIDRSTKTVALSDNSTIEYSTLILASGARERLLPIDGADLGGVASLRTVDDAERLRAALREVKNAVIVGAGFIGLEFAAVARAQGVDIVVLEYADRPMCRSVSPSISDYLTQYHRREGVNLRLSEGIDWIGSNAQDCSRVGFVRSNKGVDYPADLVLLGVGVIANDSLASSTGLATDNGILVDGNLRTKDADIFAIGDCARFESAHAGGLARFESIQNATGHAHHVAKVLAGDDAKPYKEIPWFWSIQGKTKLNIAGLRGQYDDCILRGDPSAGKFSVFSFRDGRLTAVESVNRPADHIAARKILESELSLTKTQVADEKFDLKAFSRALPCDVSPY